MALLNPLFDKLIGFIDETMDTLGIKHRKPETPIYLGATAGMRLISINDREQVMLNVRKALGRSGFSFVATHAKVISGEEEALFDWIAANYLQKTLQNQRIQQQMATLSSSPAERLRALRPLSSFKFDPNLEASERYLAMRDQGLLTFSGSVGALDLGGASTQITFEPGQDIMGHYTEYRTPSRNTHQLYAVSFLGYGQNEATVRLIRQTLSANNAKNGDIVNFPCFNTGYSSEYTEPSLRVTVTLKGFSDPAACMDLMHGLLNRDTECFGVDRCSINGSYQPQPPSDMEFYLFSGYYYTMSLFNMGDGTYSLQEFIDLQEKDVCNLTLDQLKAKYPKANTKYLESGCLNLSYIVAMLREAYGFSPSSKQLSVKSNVNGVEVSWALGRIVYEANMLHYDKILPPSEDPSFTTVMSVALIATVVAVCAMGWLLVRGVLDDKMAAMGESLNVN